MIDAAWNSFVARSATTVRSTATPARASGNPAPTNFADAMTAATASTSASPGVIAQISDAAKVAAYGSDGLKGFEIDNVTNVGISKSEWAAYWAEGARRVSASQGLPEGKYDFTNITPNQLRVIQGDLILSRGVNAEDLAQLGSYSIVGTGRESVAEQARLRGTPVNLMNGLQGEIAFYKEQGLTSVIGITQVALDVVTSRQADRARAELDIQLLSNLMVTAVKHRS